MDASDTHGPPPFTPESFTKQNLDLSDFHPLDHWPGSRYCRSLPGSWRKHLECTWDYRRRDQLARLYRRPLFCHFGHHYREEWHQRVGKEWVQHAGCRDCGKGLD